MARILTRRWRGGFFEWRSGRAVPRGQVAPFDGRLDEDRWRTVRMAWIDELPNPEKPSSDPELRRLVDALPADERHLVERVFFGGATTKAAGEEINLSPGVAERKLKSGLARLRRWYEKRPPKVDKPRKPAKVKQSTCAAEHSVYGRCKQPCAEGASMCAQHLEWAGSDIIPHPEYEAKVYRGEVTPVVAVLSETEIRTMMEGRYRGDGRRLDAFAPTDGEGQTVVPQ